MTFGANSRIFRSFMEQVLANLSAINLGTTTPNTPKAALFGNTSTPNQDDTVAHNSYSGTGGAWVQANEVIDSTGPGTNWATAGRALSSIASHFTDTAGIVWYDAADTNGAGNVTIAGAYGCMVYDDDVSDIGMTYHSFNGSQQVTAGTFTVVWDSLGVFRITLS